MPKRRCPYRIFGAHEVNPEIRGTETENRLRHFRNTMMKMQLQEGLVVQYTASDRSLCPKVQPGNLCLLEPCTSKSDLYVNDIVFCELQPGRRFFVGKIQRVEYWGYTAASARGGGLPARYNIGNEAGWCFKEMIYGRLFEVLEVGE